MRRPTDLGRSSSLAVAFAATAALLMAPECAAAVAAPQKAPPTSEAVDDDTARRAWSLLTDAEQEDALAEFEAESEYSGSFTQALIRYALSLEERDASFLPEAPPFEWFDPVRHAPAQPIERKVLEANARLNVDATKSIRDKLPTRRLDRAYRYDYALRDVVRCADPADRTRRFENALAGYAPRHDLAEAIVEKLLDDGSQQKSLAAFAHAYTDRLGNVYPGITLYDAWSSGADLEMPDVDVLGVVHDVIGDWRKWVAPVPDSQHKKLYERVGELFHDARRHRGLREAIARAWLGTALDQEPLYSGCLERFHFLWEETRCDPRAVASQLPQPAGWQEYLADLDKRRMKTEAGFDAAARRVATVRSERGASRATLIRLLRQRGAFERRAKPTPPAPKEKRAGAK